MFFDPGHNPARMRFAPKLDKKPLRRPYGHAPPFRLHGEVNHPHAGMRRCVEDQTDRTIGPVIHLFRQVVGIGPENLLRWMREIGPRIVNADLQNVLVHSRTEPFFATMAEADTSEAKRMTTVPLADGETCPSITAILPAVAADVALAAAGRS